MGRFGFQTNQLRKMLVFMLLVPLAVVFLGSSGVSWPGFFGTSSEAEASAVMFGPLPEIDGKRAYEYLKKICDIGPRTAGSKANERQRLMVKAHFEKMGAEVREQKWKIRHPQNGQVLELVNLIGAWHRERPQRVVIGAHYDTRPFADEEDDPKRRRSPSSVPTMVPQGLPSKWKSPITSRTSTLSGELTWSSSTAKSWCSARLRTSTEYFRGSKEFARRYVVDSGRTRSRYVYGIVLDMVAGKNIQIKKEPKSVEFAPDLVAQIWLVADALKIKSFKRGSQSEVMDDHVPLIEAGIPTIDLIEFDDYREYWHTIDDVPDNCSAQSLEDVGRVVTAWLTQRSVGAGTKRARKPR